MKAGGFEDEAGVPARESVQIAVEALAILRSAPEPENPESAMEFFLEQGFGQDAPHGIVGVLIDNEKAAAVLVKQFVDWVAKEIVKAAP